MWYHLYVKSEKNDANEFMKQKQTHRHRKQTLLPKQKVVGGSDKLGVWD